MSDYALKVENVSKEYRLGRIGGGTLRGDLQSLRARIMGKEDPNSPLGSESVRLGKNRYFKALDSVSFTVEQGESLGVIGLNGAGKSTLLKLIAGITLPSEGTITYRGNLASMLEVGTGFHGELTGRENVYMNGAILGMSRREISEKMQDIIDFSEIGEFIDTPVKRYSSGMYVKLAFAVAAHLDAQILLMDEVLAVGDVKFQEKCLNHMNAAAENKDNTVLYVSHNMHTIRQFCSRCIVLDKGKIIFDGDTEKAIDIYSRVKRENLCPNNDISKAPRARCNELIQSVRLTRFDILNDEGCHISKGDKLRFKLSYIAQKSLKDVYFRITFCGGQDNPVASSFTPSVCLEEGEGEVELELDVSAVAQGVYTLSAAVVERSSFKIFSDIDNVPQAASLELLPEKDAQFLWSRRFWGRTQLPPIEIK